MSKKKDQLEQIATQSVQHSGLSNLSFRTLADDAGIKSASVHYYFPNKGDLAASLIENYTQSFQAQLNQIDEHKRNLKSKLRAFVQIFEDVLENDRLCLCGMMAAEVNGLDEQSKALLKEYFLMAEQWLTLQLKQHKEELSSPLSNNKLARVIMSGLEGAILLDRVDGGSERIRAQHDLIKSLIS